MPQLHSFSLHLGFLFLLFKAVNFHLFMGACTKHGSEKLIFSYPSRGTESSCEKIFAITDTSPKNLGFWTKMNILTNVALGMNWFHSLPSKPSHLYLSPTTVLLDAEFGVKISDYGMSFFVITKFCIQPHFFWFLSQISGFTLNRI